MKVRIQMAEKERFELSRRFRDLHPQQGRLFGLLSTSPNITKILKCWRRGRDSNSGCFRITSFQDQLLKPLGHLSVNAALYLRLVYYIMARLNCQAFFLKKLTFLLQLSNIWTIFIKKIIQCVLLMCGFATAAADFKKFLYIYQNFFKM